ncbi:MAG: MlaD family protein [Rhodospirillaceae bacterium]|nr:MlaD family protein [Rhodospirillaceae bacterium]
METRASHVAVGAFVLALAVGMMGFVAWLANYSGDETYAYYDILYGGDITGLNEDGPVRYRGIVVGRVAELQIDPDNFELVRITIQVDATTPLRTDSFATIEPQGITGVLYVLLSGGSEGAEALPTTTEPPYPVIPSRPGKLAQIFESVPETLARATVLLEQITLLFSEENRAAITDTLANLQSITEKLDGSSGDVTALLTTGTEAAQNISKMSQAVETLANDLGQNVGQIGGNVDAAVSDLRSMSQSFTAVANQLDLLLTDNQQPISDFATIGLYEATQMLTEIRLLVAQLQRVAAQFERDPARFLFGDRQEGFETQP